jgi:hypothetical protein
MTVTSSITLSTPEQPALFSFEKQAISKNSAFEWIIKIKRDETKK